MKQANATSFPLLSIDGVNLSKQTARSKRAIDLSTILEEQAEQYVVVKLPDATDVKDFWVALESALTALATFQGHKKSHTLPVAVEAHGKANVVKKTDVKTAEKTFEARNANRLKELKNTILEDSHWLLSREVSELIGSGVAVKNPSAVPNRWKQGKKIFALPCDGKDLYPKYALDEGGQPLPVLKKILTLFSDTKTPWSLAIWFGSPNGWLGGKKPKDLLTAKPEEVYKAAQLEMEGPLHG